MNDSEAFGKKMKVIGKESRPMMETRKGLVNLKIE